MTHLEMAKQCKDLNTAINRLCAEADNKDIILNALLGSLTDLLMADGFSPLEVLRVCHAYIAMQATGKSQDKMDEYMDKFPEVKSMIDNSEAHKRSNS